MVIGECQQHKIDVAHGCGGDAFSQRFNACIEVVLLDKTQRTRVGWAIEIIIGAAGRLASIALLSGQCFTNPWRPAFGLGILRPRKTHQT